MVGPDYVRPVVDVPAAFRYEEKEAQETANTEWWKQFQDPVLDALIAEALANNKNIKIAAANIEQAAACSCRPDRRFSPDRIQRQRREAARKRSRGHTDSFERAEPPDLVPGPCERKLGDRSVGPHPAAL